MTKTQSYVCKFEHHPRDGKLCKKQADLNMQKAVLLKQENTKTNSLTMRKMTSIQFEDACSQPYGKEETTLQNCAILKTISWFSNT